MTYTRNLFLILMFIFTLNEARAGLISQYEAIVAELTEKMNNTQNEGKKAYFQYQIDQINRNLEQMKKYKNSMSSPDDQQNSRIDQFEDLLVAAEAQPDVEQLCGDIKEVDVLWAEVKMSVSQRKRFQTNQRIKKLRKKIKQERLDCP